VLPIFGLFQFMQYMQHCKLTRDCEYYKPC